MENLKATHTYFINKMETNNFEHLANAWATLPVCTKVSFFTFLMAKATFISTVTLLVFSSREVALISFGLYVVLVWGPAGLAIRDWLKYYMEEDPSLRVGLGSILGEENVS